MDHKELLKKYIKYIRDVEGADYIDPNDERHNSEVNFSDEEWEELKAMTNDSQ